MHNPTFTTRSKASLSKNHFSLTFALGLAVPFALGGALLTGCFDSGTGSAAQNSASIRGEILGDVETSGSLSDTGWAGAIVTSHSILADGTLGAAEDSAVANAQGQFTLETDARGSQERILRARRGQTEWMARFQGTLQGGQTENSRPLNLESTVETAVYLELKKTAEGREVSSSEVNLAVDASVAASTAGVYRGSQAARDSLVARFAASVKAAARARNAFLAAADSQYTASRSTIENARVRAEAEFDASLYAAAGDTVEAGTARRAYVNAIVKAHVAAGVERTAYARSVEASYQAALRASAQVSDSTRARMARSYARLLVIAADTAMRYEFKEAGSSQARLTLVATAGARFKTSVDTASSRARIDSAVARFRADVRAAFDDSTGTDTASFNLFGNVASTLNMTNLFTSLNASLKAVLIGSNNDGAAVGEAYAEAHVDAQADLQSAISAQNDDDDEARAAANLLAFVSVHSSSN